MSIIDSCRGKDQKIVLCGYGQAKKMSDVATAALVLRAKIERSRIYLSRMISQNLI